MPPKASAFSRLGALVLLFAGLAGPVGADSLEDGVLAEINYARTHPAAYAHLLRRQTAGGPEDPSDESFAPPYGDDGATEEAYAFLMRQRPLPPLRADRRLAAAAAEHSSGQGRTGRVGHFDEHGTLLQRFQHHGLWASMNSEDISYGYTNPHNVVVQLIVDSGIPGRGHRHVIFDPALQAAGVGCDRHSVYGEVCVIDFAGGIFDRSSSSSLPAR